MAICRLLLVLLPQTWMENVSCDSDTDLMLDLSYRFQMLEEVMVFGAGHMLIYYVNESQESDSDMDRLSDVDYPDA